MADQLARPKGLREERSRAQANEEGEEHADELGTQAAGDELAVGGREAEAGTVALRRLGSNEQKVIDANEALVMLRAESLAPDMAD